MLHDGCVSTLGARKLVGFLDAYSGLLRWKKSRYSLPSEWCGDGIDGMAIGNLFIPAFWLPGLAKLDNEQAIQKHSCSGWPHFGTSEMGNPAQK